MLRRTLLTMVPAALLRGQNPSWDRPQPPHKIADNLYYVGSEGLSSYLITTSAGHILINTSFARTIPIIRANVEALGQKFTDIRIILGSHAHNDHMEGNALGKRLSGGQVFVMEGDDRIIATGGREGQYLYRQTWEPCPVDRVLHDGDTVTLGGATLTAVWTPGHTRGCTTWTMRVNDRGKSYLAVVVGSPNVNAGFRLVGNTDYPQISEDFARTFKTLKSIPCEIFLGAHGDYYGMLDKLKRMKGGENPFVDPAGYRAYIADREKAYLATLAEQRKG